jgi:hypothetical protein
MKGVARIMLAVVEMAGGGEKKKALRSVSQGLHVSHSARGGIRTADTMVLILDARE